MQWRKHTLFNKWCWSNWTSISKEINLDTDLIPFKKKSNSKWIIDLNVKYKAVKLLEENRGENPDDLEYGNDFTYSTKCRLCEGNN